MIRATVLIVCVAVVIDAYSFDGRHVRSSIAVTQQVAAALVDGAALVLRRFL